MSPLDDAVGLIHDHKAYVARTYIIMKRPFQSLGRKVNKLVFPRPQIFKTLIPLIVGDG
jgi:hypothetical protein